MLKKWIALLAIFGCFQTQTLAQISDSFTDGDFTANPVWSGNTADWMVNASNQLQSNNTVANAAFYLSTPNTLATSAQWEFYAKLAFNTSSANYVDVFLTAAESDLGSNTNTGYFVRLGGTADEICLYKKTTGGVIAKIIDGVDAVLNTSNNTLKIKVIRDATNQFTLYRDLSGTGASYLSEGSIVDATFTSSGFFGVYVKQSTASFFQKHFFTDFAVTAYAPDTTPPVLISVTATSNSTIDLVFNEPLDPVSSQVAANYQANNGIGAPASAQLDALNNTIVHLSYAAAFPNGQTHTLVVSAIADALGNALSSVNATFFFYTPQQFDVVIDEIMADPTPQVGLPNNEWIELRNTAAFPINLQGWRIGDASGISAALPAFILKPDSLVIICTGSATAALAGYGNVIAVSSFPSLDNTGEILYLQSVTGNLIHTVHYTASWYQNELKQEGGWSLEMIDVRNPCSGFSNWRASNDLRGGTPGAKNSLDAINVDNTAPQLVRAYMQNNTQMVLVFDEPLDSVSAASINHYTISDGVGVPVGATVLVPGLNRVVLQLATPLQSRKVYTIQVQSITDCHGNVIGSAKTARVGLSEVADSLDIVINEILFNPPSNGADFVELYNRSNKIIDLSQTYLANRNSAGTISSIYQVYPEPYLLFPEDFLVLSENINWVKTAFVSTNLNAFLQMSALPSYNDDESHVIVLNGQGRVTDEVFYSDKWHFKLIDNVEGVSLERIDYAAASNNAENWHSAATSVGYATPGYKNSQFRINDGVQGEVKLTPEILTPDNDGWDDFAQISYQFPQSGYVANITIFDAAGRIVKSLQKNAVCGTIGSFRWDGLGDKSQQLPTGVYVVLTDVFNLTGQRKQFKNTIVVARRN